MKLEIVYIFQMRLFSTDAARRLEFLSPEGFRARKNKCPERRYLLFILTEPFPLTLSNYNFLVHDIAEHGHALF